MAKPPAVPTLTLPNTAEVLAQTLATWGQLAQGAYSDNTVRAWCADWRIFAAFCAERGAVCLPADPVLVRDFVLACAHGRDGQKPKSVATLRRYVASISRLHKAAGLESPTHSEAVSLAVRASARTLGGAQSQAGPLNWSLIQAYLQIKPKVVRDHRDRALVSVAYDGMLRAEEAVSIDVEDIRFEDNGSATLLIKRSKTDPEGKGTALWLAPSTARLIEQWMKRARISTGALFCRVLGYHTIGARLTAQSVTDVFQRVGRWCGLSERQVREISSHSARVGATQDLFVANMEMPAVMQQGRWADARMPARYAARVLAGRGAMARLALQQDRKLTTRTRVHGAQS